MRGVVDFREARIRDVNWWRRSNVLIREMEREDDRVIAAAMLQRYCAYVANGQLTDDSFKKFQELSQQECVRLIELLRPWTAAASARTDAIEQVTETYKRLVGDPKDPEFMARMAAEVKQFEEERRAVKAETDEQRVARLLRERAARQ